MADEIPEHCPGTQSEKAGKESSCQGCPSQSDCASGKASLPDPAISVIAAKLASVKRKFLVLSGKGGVGKSTVSSLLSRAFAADPEANVGILDIDICGPSIPRIMGCEGEIVHQSGSGWSPVYVEDNLSVMSIGFLLNSPKSAVIWRGPRKNGIIKQFLTEVDWGTGLDVLVVDTPPGTSDEHISLATYLSKSNIDGAILVTTPQDISILDVRKEIDFCKKTNIPIIGIVENMSVFVCSNCNHATELFPKTGGGGEGLAKEFQLEFLGRVPIDPNLARSCDNGTNFITEFPESPTTKFMLDLLSDFRRCQTFDHKNGFFTSKQDYLGVGNVPLTSKSLTVKDLFDMYNYDPVLTYGVPRARAPKPIVPSYVSLEKKTLKFEAYYKETVNDSAEENFRVRNVKIYYYLEDDTIMVDEPKIENSGLMQGKLLQRHKVPKNDIGETWHWKDLNIKCEVMFYSRVFRIVDCDAFTKNFYESEGVIMNDPEPIPRDPYIEKRTQAMQKRTFHTPDVLCDTRKKYMEFGQRVLRFKCLWDEREAEYGSMRKYDLFYHLADDMIEVCELHDNNNGRDPFKLLLHKTRLPRNWKDMPLQFPVISLEPTQREIVEYYGPKDLKIGETINVFGRRFLIYDMDTFTKQFYRDQFGFTDFTPVCIEMKQAKPLPAPIPPWHGWGSPEDSLQSCLRIVPTRPRYDAMKRLVFELKVLKFGAVMDSTRPEDQGREFTISYRLVDDKISVYERPVRNSGWPGGKFLDYCRVIKPGSSKNDPEYYGPQDFFIGSMLDIFNFRFCLNSADPFVLEFINKNPECFPEHVRENLREYFECERQENPLFQKEPDCDPGRPVCEEPVGEGFFERLGLGIQKLGSDPCSDNPNPNPMPYDWDMCRNLGYNCGIQRPEYGTDDLEPIDQVCDKPCPGNPDMFEAKDLAVSQPERYLAPDPLMPNPKYTENASVIPRDKYNQLKQTRFDCYNPPDADKQYEIFQKQSRFNCPCPPEEPRSHLEQS